MLPHIAPPHWWNTPACPTLQLMVHYPGIGSFTPRIEAQGVVLEGFTTADSPNYLFLDLRIAEGCPAGAFVIRFQSPDYKDIVSDYELHELKPTDRGISGADVVYLLMPDRFAKGHNATTVPSSFREKENRRDPNGRHGGNLQGIIKHLDYFVALGVTALWLTPVQLNDQSRYSYHGYAATDFYRTDPRLGGSSQYAELVEKAAQKGLKIVADLVVNHCGKDHWWMNDLPFADWVHAFEKYHFTIVRGEYLNDPYHTDSDRLMQEKGWFSADMPDLNQGNKYVENYLLQWCVWWVGHFGVHAVRIDTFQFLPAHFIDRLLERLHNEYPDLTVLAEVWQNEPALVVPWLKLAKSIPIVTDFPLREVLVKAFQENEGPETGLSRIYRLLTMDYLYPAPHTNLVFIDNHDTDRYISAVNYHRGIMRMAISVLLTVRGIPQVYYGTEVLSDGYIRDGHGAVRQDFPGGWPDDEVSAFEQQGLDLEQNAFGEWLARLLAWRKTSKAVRFGQMKHFAPRWGLYVYARQHEDETVVVVLNNQQARMVHMERYASVMGSYTKAFDVASGRELHSLEWIHMPGKSVRILELKQ